MISFGEIKKILELFCPKNNCLKDDYSGVQVPMNNEKMIKKILITLDCTSPVIQKAIDEKIDLIITHHPFLWGGPIKARRNPEKKLKYYLLRKNQIGLISLHTNYDDMYLKQDLADFLFSPKKVNNETKLLTSFELNDQLTFEEILKIVSKKLKTNNFHYFGNKKQMVKTIGIAPGASGFLIENVCNQNIDLFICGELKWSNLIQISEKELMTIELGHHSEEIFTNLFPIHLNKFLLTKNVELEIICYFHGSIKQPYS